MALYLNNLDLNGNQLIKAVVHPLGTAPSTAQEGQIYYDTGDNVVYVNTSTTVNSPTWVNMQSGDLTGITITTDSGGSSAASDTSGNADFSILGTSGVGVTNSGATITVTAVASEIDHDSLSNFASNEHFTQGNITTVGTIGTGVWQGTAIATTYIADDAITEDKLANTLLAEIDANTAKVTNTDVSVSAANLKTVLQAGFPENAVSLGDSGDTITVPGDMTVSGDLTVTGDTITVNTTTLTVKDPLIVIANNNAADVLDTGFFSTYVAEIAGASAQRYTGLFRDASETGDPYTFFDTTTIEPGLNTSGNYTGVVDTSHASFKYAPIKAGIITATTNFAGPLTGAVTGNADTATKIASITNTNIVQLASTQTLTNKTIDANGTGNSITNIDIGNMTADVIQLSSESFSDNDTSLMTSAALLDKFAVINANTSGTAGGLSATLAVASGGTGATSLDSAGIVEKSGAQTIAGAKTFSSGIVLDDGSGASPVLKFKNEADTHWTVQNDNSNNLKFTQATDLRVTFNAGGDVTIPGSIDLGGSIDVDGTMEADAITLAGSSVHATDTNTSLGTSDTVVPSQKAVKAYVDAQGSSSSNTGGRNAFVLAHVGTGAGEVSGNTGSANGNNVFTITHAMGASRNYGVEVIRNSNNSGGGETVIVDVTRPTNTTIVITFAAAVVASDYTALVCKY